MVPFCLSFSSLLSSLFFSFFLLSPFLSLQFLICLHRAQSFGPPNVKGVLPCLASCFYIFYTLRVGQPVGPLASLNFLLSLWVLWPHPICSTLFPLISSYSLLSSSLLCSPLFSSFPLPSLQIYLSIRLSIYPSDLIESKSI